jgi:hypothetical protein
MKARKLLADVPATSQHRRDTELEQWICERLKLRDLFAGDTTTEIRRDRLRVTLLERGLTESIAGSRGGKTVKWRAIHKQLYGEDLA